MPKPVKLKKNQEFTFSKTSSAVSKYDWDGWFSGELLMLERSDVDADGNLIDGGEKRDYEVATEAMIPKIKTAARKRYKIVQVSRKDADGNKLENALIIRARDMSPEERVEEDKTRAEEKAAKQEAKQKAEANGTPTDAPTPQVQTTSGS